MNTFSLIGLPGAFELLLFLPAILCFVLCLWALVDILKNSFQGANDKVIWILVVLFLPFFGPLLYMFIGRKQKLTEFD